jgi:hypothetical protein
MTLTKLLGSVLMVLAAGFTLISSGCGQGAGSTHAKDKGPATQDSRKVHTHDEWWCTEHGVPEHECSACDEDVARQFKAKKYKGKPDWCDKHDRAASQCFVCNPEQREVYALKYRNKYGGKEPPPIDEKN